MVELGDSEEHQANLPTHITFDVSPEEFHHAVQFLDKFWKYTQSHMGLVIFARH
jgi:hypothetical protein